jgi:hypothetical protein
MITKNIGYAYPSSQLAKMLDFGKSGCYYLAIYDDTMSVKYSDVYFAHKNLGVVVERANQGTEQEPWGEYSMYPEK